MYFSPVFAPEIVFPGLQDADTYIITQLHIEEIRLEMQLDIMSHQCAHKCNYVELFYINLGVSAVSQKSKGEMHKERKEERETEKYKWKDI